MTNENKPDTKKTLAELSGRVATVGEERPLTVREGHKRAEVGERRHFATVEELDRAFLTPDQRQAAQAEFDKEKKGKIKTHDGAKKLPGKDDGRIFEEGDIIEWMFRNIIMKSMDWTGNKGVNLLSFLGGEAAVQSVDFLSDAGSKKLKQLKNKYDKWNPCDGGMGNYPEDNTTKFQKTIDALHNKELKDCDDYASKENAEMLVSALQLASEGRMNRLNTMMNGRISPQTMEMLNGLSPEQCQQLFASRDTLSVAAATIETAMVVKQYSANIAYVRLMTEKMVDKEQPKRASAELFAQYQEEARLDMLAYMAEAQGCGRDEIAARDELFDLSIKAGQHVNNEIAARNYNEHGLKPGRNKSLEKIEDLTAVTKDSPYRGQTRFVDFTNEMIDISTAQQRALTPVEQEENVLTDRWNGHQERVTNFRNRVNQIRSNQRSANTNTQTPQQMINQGGRQ